MYPKAWPGSHRDFRLRSLLLALTFHQCLHMSLVYTVLCFDFNEVCTKVDQMSPLSIDGQDVQFKIGGSDHPRY